MKKILLALAALLLSGVPALAQTPSTVRLQQGTSLVGSGNPLYVTGTVSPSGTQNVNITQILGAAPSLTNYLWVFPATGATWAATQSGTWTVQPGNTANTTPWLFTGSGTAGTAATGVLTVQGIASMTPIQTTQSSAGNVPIGITPTDRTITSATGASQTVMSANASRKSLTIVNTGNANCGINPTGGTAAIGGAGTLTLMPGGSYTPRVPTLAAVTAICTAAQPLYADES